MANNQEIAALAVSLSLDSGNFNKAMSAINKEIKNLDRDFKNAGQGIQGFEDSIAGLQAKMETTKEKMKLLNIKLEEQKKAYSSLETTLDSQKAKLQLLEQTLGKGSAEWKKQAELVQRNADKLRKMGSDIGSTEGQIRGLNNTLDSIGNSLQKASQHAEKTGKDFQQMADKLKNAGESMKSAGESLSTKLSAPMAAVGTVAGAAAIEYDKALATMRAKTALSGDEMKKLESIAKKVYTDGIGQDMTTVTDTVSQLYNTLGDVPNLDGLAKQLIAISDLMGYDMTESITGMQSAMNTFKISGPQALDYITKAGQQMSGVFRDDMPDALTELMPSFQDMGANVGQAFETMILASKSGMESFDSLSSLIQGFSENATSGTDDVATAFASLGGGAQETFLKMQKGQATVYDVFNAAAIQIGKVDDKNKQAQLGATLFGDVWSEAGAQAITSLGNVTGGIGKVEGAAEKAANTANNNFGDRFKKMWRGLQEDIVPVGDAILKIAENVMPPLIAVVTKIAQGFASLSPGMQTAIVSFGALIAAIGPFLMIIGSMATGIGSIITTVSKVAEVVGKMGPIFSKLGTIFNVIRTAGMAVGAAIAGISAPVWIAIGVITALIAAGVLIWKNWDTIKEKASQLGQYLSGVWEQIKSSLSTAWENIKSSTISIWNGIKSFLAQWGTTILAILTGPIGMIVLLIKNNWNTIKSVTSTIWNAVKSVTTSVWNSIKSVVNTVVNGIKSVVSSVFNAIKSTISTVLNSIKSIVVSIWNAIKSSVTTALSNIKSAVSTGFNNVKSTATSVMNTIKSAITNAWNNIKSSVSNAVGNIRSAVSSGFSGLKSIMTAPFEAAKQVIDGIIGKISSAVSKVKSVAGKILTTEGPTFVENPTASTETPTMSVMGTATISTTPTMSTYSTGGSIMDSIADLNSTMSTLDFSSNNYNSSASDKILASAMSTKSDSVAIVKGLETQNKNLETQNNLLMQMVAMLSQGQQISVQVDGREVARATSGFMDTELSRNVTSKTRARGGK